MPTRSALAIAVAVVAVVGIAGIVAVGTAGIALAAPAAKCLLQRDSDPRKSKTSVGGFGRQRVVREDSTRAVTEQSGEVDARNDRTRTDSPVRVLRLP